MSVYKIFQSLLLENRKIHENGFNLLNSSMAIAVPNTFHLFAPHISERLPRVRNLDKIYCSNQPYPDISQVPRWFGEPLDFERATTLACTGRT